MLEIDSITSHGVQNGINFQWCDLLVVVSTVALNLIIISPVTVGLFALVSARLVGVLPVKLVREI